MQTTSLPTTDDGGLRHTTDAYVLQSLPYPLASAWHRALHERSTRGWVQVLETELRVLLAIALIAYAQLPADDKVDASVAKLSKASEGTWHAALCILVRYLRGKQLPPLCEDLLKWANKTNLNVLNNALSLRNEWGHPTRSKRSDPEITRALSTLLYDHVGSLQWLATHFWLVLELDHDDGTGFFGHVRVFQGKEARPVPHPITWQERLGTGRVYALCRKSGTAVDLCPLVQKSGEGPEAQLFTFAETSSKGELLFQSGAFFKLRSLAGVRGSLADVIRQEEARRPCVDAPKLAAEVSKLKEAGRLQFSITSPHPQITPPSDRGRKTRAVFGLFAKVALLAFLAVGVVYWHQSTPADASGNAPRPRAPAPPTSVAAAKPGAATEKAASNLPARDKDVPEPGKAEGGGSATADRSGLFKRILAGGGGAAADERKGQATEQEEGPQDARAAEAEMVGDEEADGTTDRTLIERLTDEINAATDALDGATTASAQQIDRLDAAIGEFVTFLRENRAAVGWHAVANSQVTMLRWCCSTRPARGCGDVLRRCEEGVRQLMMSARRGDEEIARGERSRNMSARLELAAGVLEVAERHVRVAATTKPIDPRHLPASWDPARARTLAAKWAQDVTGAMARLPGKYPDPAPLTIEIQRWIVALDRLAALKLSKAENAILEASRLRLLQVLVVANYVDRHATMRVAVGDRKAVGVRRESWSPAALAWTIMKYATRESVKVQMGAWQNAFCAVGVAKNCAPGRPL